MSQAPELHLPEPSFILNLRSPHSQEAGLGIRMALSHNGGLGVHAGVHAGWAPTSGVSTVPGIPRAVEVTTCPTLHRSSFPPSTPSPPVFRGAQLSCTERAAPLVSYYFSEAI